MRPGANLFRFCFIAVIGLGFLSYAAHAASALVSPGSVPFYFEANHGQVDGSAQFFARGIRSQLLVSPDAAELRLFGQTSSHLLRMRFIGANSEARVSGVDELSGKINYLIGNDPSRWRTSIPTFTRIGVTGLYPGIDLVYYGNQSRLEYDLTLAAQSDPRSIAIRFEEVDKLSISADGELVLDLGGTEIRQPKPVVYQVIQGHRVDVDGGYKLMDDRTVTFSVGEYDHDLPLVIDPMLSYSTYFGGIGTDNAWAVAVDTNGFVYIAGQTTSTQSSSGKTLATPGAFQTNFQGGSITGDAFVAKFDNLGTNLIYLTYLGGNGDDVAYGLAVDDSGDAYVAGATDSANFPVKNAIYTNINGNINPFSSSYLADGFVTELNPAGSSLVYSTYLGGSGADAAKAIALDSSGNAYVTGFTFSTNFPVTVNAYQKHSGVSNWVYQAYYNCNAFAAEIGAGGASLVYSTYFGGNFYDVGQGIAVDNSNNIYITGYTGSTNFPVSHAVMQVIGTNIYNGSLLNGATNQVPGFGFDAFVAKFAPGFNNLVYSSYLGGVNNDIAEHVAPDVLGNAYVTGWTVSTNFPITVTNLPAIQNGLVDILGNGAPITNAFLSQIIWNGANAVIGNSVVFGGTNAFSIDIGYGVALDPSGNIYVAGSTTSTNFPAVNASGYLAATNAGDSDAFIIAFNNDLSGVIYSATLGGAANDSAYSVAVDPDGDAYIAGQTYSATFPTNNARQVILNGTANAFLAKVISNTSPPSPAISVQNGQGAVTWPSGLPYQPELAHSFVLQSNTNLLSTNWVTVPGSPILSNNDYSVVFNPTNNTGFFRLELVNP
jgi:hypothetical protein